jgi:hypothetical protein
MKVVKALVVLYIAVALVTFILQLPNRYPACSATGGCATSLGKGVVWSAIWPRYWAIQLHPME